MSYLPPEIIDQIRTTARIEEVIPDYVKLKRSGSSQVGDCPQCGGKGKLSVSKAKQIWKCFTCDKSGGDALSFLTTMQHMAFPDAARQLAARYNIDIPEGEAPEKPRKGKGKKGKDRFRDIQLLESGIPQKAQEWYLDEGTTKQVQSDRYQSATIDQLWNVVPGDDMILHYLDIDGKPLTYTDRKGKARPLIRVRWQNPGLHCDKNGNPVKYQTPPGGGSPLWLPQWMIQAYAKFAPLHTLYITEGEKKADALCLNDMPAVGITGIHNFTAQGDMPRQLELIVRRGQVKRVCFLIDADWQDLKASNGSDIARRPNLFFRAVLKFQKYFQAFALEGLDLQIYFGHGLETVYKGVDDLLARGVAKDEHLHEDLDQAFLHREGQGKYVKVYDITSMSDYKLKELWHLESPQAFRDYHQDELLTLREFTHNGLKYKVVDGKIELDQKLLPHEKYWIEEWKNTKDGMGKVTYHYDVLQVNDFLKNRGYGLYRVHDRGAVRYVHQAGKVIRQIDAYDIKRYILDFTREINQLEVLRMLMNGSRNFFASDKLEHMHPVSPAFLQPDRDTFYMIFEDQYWKITASAITSHKLDELPGVVWDNRIVKFRPKLTKPMIKVDRQGDHWILDPTSDMDRSDIARFFVNTSLFNWRALYSEIQTDEGIVYAPKARPVVTDDERNFNLDHLVCKMLATGYVLHDYRNKAQMKAIIAVDHQESEVGKSEGGTGKSIWSNMFEHMAPTEVIDGKKPRLQDDPFIYANVDERTAVIVFDDCRVNLDFEFFLSQITRGVEVNPKGKDRFKIDAPKFIFSTNHAVNGDGNSFERRQYYISFSDYYNRHRTPQDDFGRVLFHEWDFEQWNLFYNFMACCVQTYLRYPDMNTYTIPIEDVRRRQMRQRMGEEFLELMETWWADKINHAVHKTRAMEEFFKLAPRDRHYVKSNTFKAKVKAYCDYAGLAFNPIADSTGRIRSGSEEYLLVADDQFDREIMSWIN